MQTDKRYNIVADQASTYQLAITWLDPTGQPVNLDGYTAKMQVRLGYPEPSAVVTISSDNGEITLGGSAGTINLEISAEKMAPLAARVYVYDLRLDNGAVVTRLIEGTFTVQATVTRV